MTARRRKSLRAKLLEAETRCTLAAGERGTSTSELMDYCFKHRDELGLGGYADELMAKAVKAVFERDLPKSGRARRGRP